MKKIMVVNPPKLFNPYETFLSIGTPSFCPDGNWLNPEDLIVCSQLRDKGYDVEYFDADNQVTLTPKGVAKFVLDSQPDAVIMNSETIDFARSPLSSYENVNIIADIVKTVVPEIYLILYGCHPILDTSSISPSFDVVIKGEAEANIVELLRSSKISWHSKTKYFEGYVQNLDTLPIPAYDMGKGIAHLCSEYASPSLHGKKFTQVIMNRGCPYSCDFCVRKGTGETLRTMSPDRVRKELEVLKSLGYEAVYFIDDTWGYNRTWAEKVCDILKDLELSWTCQTRSSLMADESLVKKMARSHCVQAGIGVECYDDKVLERNSKYLTTEIIDKAVKNLEESNLDIVVFLLLGLREQTHEDIEKTDVFVKKHKFVGAGPFLVTPYPGTPMWLRTHHRITGNVLESLTKAGLCNNTLFKDMIEARGQWMFWDKEWGGEFNVLSQIKKWRPNVYNNWLKYVKEMDLEEVLTNAEC